MTGKASVTQTVCDAPAHNALKLRHLDIATIKPYEHNPRRSVNPEYARIKASIRVDGLGQPLIVTQRPGESHYVVHAGGNTRLRILQELYAETGEPSFGTVPCVVRPWTHEADALMAHLKENDLRGALTFLDKALAVADAKRFLEAELGVDDLSQIRLAELLGNRGYSVSQGLISQLAYVTERLLPVLPQALESGIGRPQIARVRALDRVVRALWLDRAVDAEWEYDRVFEALCRRCDTPDWDIANLRRALEAEITERAGLSLHAVSIEIDTRLAGHVINLPERSVDNGVDNPAATDEGTPRPGTDAPLATDTRPPETAPGQPRQARGSSAASPSLDRTRLNSEPGEARDEDEASADADAAVGVPVRVAMKSLRARLWTLASRLAQRNGLGALVQPLSGQGLGFVLRDVLDPALVEQLDEDALAQVSMVWWHLAACAELTVAPLDALLPALPEESVLRRALVDQDAELLFASVWTLDPGHAGYRLWRRVDERDWQDLLGLMDAYRALHRTAAAGNQNLWGPA